MLDAYIDNRMVSITLPPELMSSAADFFARMDSDMDKGWQMGREWIDNPDREQRCQIAADKLLAAIEGGNDNMKILMAGYIVSRMPGVTALRIDTAGEMLETEFLVSSAP